MTIDVYVLTGCEYCASLEAGISSAGLNGSVTIHTDQGNGGCGSANPSTVINGVCKGYPGCDVNCQLAAIKAAVSSSSTPTATPAKPTTASTAAAPAAAASPSWMTAKWGNELTVEWGAKNPKPTIAETPTGWEAPDISLTPVLPLPPAMAAGITVSLRDEKRMPRGRKVA
jgi:hypothetical protein